MGRSKAVVGLLLFPRIVSFPPTLAYTLSAVSLGSKRRAMGWCEYEWWIRTTGARPAAIRAVVEALSIRLALARCECNKA
jgi:hypothetical protein